LLLGFLYYNRVPYTPQMKGAFLDIINAIALAIPCSVISPITNSECSCDLHMSTCGGGEKNASGRMLALPHGSVIGKSGRRFS